MVATINDLDYTGTTTDSLVVEKAPATVTLSDLNHVFDGWEPWAAQELSRHDWRMILEAGHAVMRFSARDWLNTIDVPTSVLITMRDTTVPTRRQVRLFEGIEGSEAFRVDGDHSAVASVPQRFVPTLLRAVQSVVERANSEVHA